ncbi:MAG TPA: hypothetical protein VMA73_22670 [Streptosporangiaceae bacterium]|nr:hypothetical protein [Streptosporangiaceae bacterium]
MDDEARIPRTRGAVCGVLLILLGLWGGLAPFVGPYLHFGFTPDKAWEYTSGRLYLSAIPGAAALLGGLMALITRNRAFGISGGLLGALGGAWFVVGGGIVLDVLKNTSVNVGAPLQSTSMTATLQDYLERAALFFGLGALILFVGALAIGRFSMLAAKDVEVETDGYSYTSQPDQFSAPTSAYRTTTGQFPSVQDTTTAQYPPPAGT